MNERIEQLAEQAGLLHEHMTTGERADYLNKFNALGKLIVKECATLTLNPMQIDEAQYYHGWLDYRDKIFEHFGVR